jgi:hypothetical protein
VRDVAGKAIRDSLLEGAKTGITMALNENIDGLADTSIR